MNDFVKKYWKNKKACRCSTCGRIARVYLHNSYGLCGCKHHLLIYFKYDGDSTENILNAMKSWEEQNSNIGGFNYAK